MTQRPSSPSLPAIAPVCAQRASGAQARGSARTLVTSDVGRRLRSIRARELEIVRRKEEREQLRLAKLAEVSSAH